MAEIEIPRHLKVASPLVKEFKSHFEQLQEIRSFTKGWDSYEADPPTEIACDIATTLLKALEQRTLPIVFLTATSASSILVKHTANGSSVTWEIDPDGEIGVMEERPQQSPIFHSPTPEEIEDLVAGLTRNG